MKKYAGVLKRVKEIEQKRGINYARTGGHLYKGLNIAYTLLAVYTLFINIISVIGYSLYFSADNSAAAKSTALSIGIATLIMILGYVLHCLKLHIPAALLNVVPSVFLIVSFGKELEKVAFREYDFRFYWRHFVPLLIMIIAIIWMTVIAIREKVKTNKLYNKVTSDIFEIYKNSTDEISDEQWNEFLENYDPQDYKRKASKTENE